MSHYRLLRDTEHRIAEIYHYTVGRWGEDQALRYYNGLLDMFEAIAERRVPWGSLPTKFGIHGGHYCRFERHYIYWRMLDDGIVGIVAILHERMHRQEWLHEAFND